jgi:hypothetical protein
LVNAIAWYWQLVAVGYVVTITVATLPGGPRPTW